MRDLRAFVALDGRVDVLGESELGMDRTLTDVDGGFEVFNALLILQSIISRSTSPVHLPTTISVNVLMME